ncbi:hypothetical protein [Chenggangzhangella methanolivorans]|uniref:Uncharacterized protein n=1 Tax=Chenggangzhangella methanolivorans TaxID=1437009 RepID=A0A9E6RBT8_9HYPH|nr:hypothetical protein [Chenggangzhangella methanolivorans]QZO01465.1 hypothetical protein K6K41_08515 [Chenggangzhangella methanolivorans]
MIDEQHRTHTARDLDSVNATARLRRRQTASQTIESRINERRGIGNDTKKAPDYKACSGATTWLTPASSVTRTLGHARKTA